MSGEIEPDAENILPRTGYIPVNEPNDLRTQAVAEVVRTGPNALHCGLARPHKHERPLGGSLE
jgi:hypothetical protein